MTAQPDTTATQYLPPLPAPQPPIPDYEPPAIDRDLRKSEPAPEPLDETPSA